MSTLIKTYIMSLLIYQGIRSISQMSRFVGNISHDRLTDLLDYEWDGQTLLFSYINPVIPQSEGYLIIDDTVIPKPYSKKLESFGYIYDHKERKAVYGIGMVFLLWTDGKLRLPIAYSIYKKGGEKKTDLALKLLSYAKNKLKLKKIKGILLDSWYSSKKILKRIRDYGWHYYTQVKSNRLFNGKQLKHYRSGAFWHEVGYLSGKERVLLVRHYKKYYITSKIDLNSQEVREVYKVRQEIEEVIKILKSELHLCFLGDKKEKHWEHHISLVLSSFVVLEKISKKYKLTPYRMREKLFCRNELYLNDLLQFIYNDA